MNSITLTLHDIVLNIGSHNSEILNWIARSYSSYCDSSPQSQKISYFLQLEESGSPNELLLSPPQDGVPIGIGLLNALCEYKAGSLYTVRTENNQQSLQFDLSTRRLQANLSPVVARCEETFIYSVMREFLKNLIFPFSGMLNIHAAALQSGDKTICLLGDSGAGKSTTALKLLDANWKFLSDDSPIIKLCPGGVSVLSSLDQMSVSENTLSMFPHLRPQISGRRQVSGKYYFSRQCFEDSHCFGPSKVTHLILLKRGNYGKPRLVPLAGETLFRYLVQESLVIFRSPPNASAPEELSQVNAVMFDTLTSLIGQAKALTLEYDGSHLQDIPELLSCI